jgi:hypothetical protein
MSIFSLGLSLLSMRVLDVWRLPSLSPSLFHVQLSAVESILYPAYKFKELEVQRCQSSTLPPKQIPPYARPTHSSYSPSPRFPVPPWRGHSAAADSPALGRRFQHHNPTPRRNAAWARPDRTIDPRVPDTAHQSISQGSYTPTQRTLCSSCASLRSS